MLDLKYHNKNIKYSHFFIFIWQTGPYNESEVKNVSLDYGVDNNLQSCITSVSAGKVVDGLCNLLGSDRFGEARTYYFFPSTC